jgi:transposase
VAGVMIGVDPHKASHTAHALDEREQRVGQLRVRASSRQVEILLGWAMEWPERTWAVEGARGLGRLLSQQLIAAGERVVDVQPKLAARVRLLDTTQVNKNDPNDARAVAVAALRARDLPNLTAEDETEVMRLWSRRFHDLGRLRTQLLCRLHTVLCELVPGGFSKKLTAQHATAILDSVTAQAPIVQAKLDLARELLIDLERIDEQRRDARARTARAVAASGSSITEIRGVGPIIAGAVLGYVRDIGRFTDRAHFASYNGTAPIEVSSGNRKVYRLSRRGNRQLNHAIHMAAVSQIRYRGTEGRIYYEKKVAEGMTGKSALRALKRKISDTLYARMTNDARNASDRDPGGQMGNGSASSAASSHPDTPALRTSHSRAKTNPKTVATPQAMPTPLPAPARRQTSRSAAGVKVEPRPGPRSGRGQERP